MIKTLLEWPLTFTGKPKNGVETVVHVAALVVTYVINVCIWYNVLYYLARAVGRGWRM